MEQIQNTDVEVQGTQKNKVRIMGGNELIVQGALEAGFSLYTGYPGSPLADYFNILYKKHDELKARGIKVVIANSEANAAAMASGAKQAGRDVVIAMKSMGLHVAADALSVGNFANPGTGSIDPKTGEHLKAGVVVVVGDDPWSISTSTPADSRYLYKHLHIPFLEPATPQELKDWMKVALDISRRSTIYQGLLLTTFMAEGGGRVSIGPEAPVELAPKTLNTREFNLTENVMVPPNSLVADTTMIQQRFPRVKKILAELALDKSYGPASAEIGFISSGVSFETLKQVMEEGHYLDQFSLYKVACSYPLVDELLVPYLKKLKTLIVVEEKRGFLEAEISELCQRHGIRLQILGKQFGAEVGYPAHGGLNYEIIRDCTEKALKFLKLPTCDEIKHQVIKWEGALPKRLPTFCPGCPHRETLSLLKEIRKILSREQIDLVTHGDVGCYSLSFLPPFKEMHNLSAMGQGGALGAGLDMFSTNPSVVLMGDSTFFHSGMTDISNSLQCGHSITYILLDNDNTAMTGHQMTPASGISVDGAAKPRQSMLQVVQSLGVTQALEVNPSDRYFYRNILLDYIKKSGVKVIVSNKECGLTFQGRLKSQDRKRFASGQTQEVKTFYQINTQVCEDCRVCVEMTGCPGLSQTFDGYGSKVMIDPQICVADSYCTKFKVCPSFEKVEVLDYHPSLYKKVANQTMDMELPLPTPLKSFEHLAEGVDWRVVVTGVGGSGVTTISRVLSRAAQEMNGRQDLDFKFMDQKGLAQRNGNVTGHLAIYHKDKSHAAVIPLGTADLLLSPDLLDGTGQLSFLSGAGEAILDRDFQLPLSVLLDYGEEGEPLTAEILAQKLNERFGKQVSLYGLKELCDLILGKAVYASAMILGVAFQKGRFPFTLENMQQAFNQTMPKDELQTNWRAFELGRMLVTHGEDAVRAQFAPVQARPDLVALYRESVAKSFMPWKKRDVVMKIYQRELDRLIGYFPKLDTTHLAQYIHDLYIYDRGEKMDDFLLNAGTISKIYPEDLQAMALRTLAKTYWIKDEVFVAHLMIDPIKEQRDQANYGTLGTSYRIVRINRPSFDVFGKKIEFDLSPKRWMLKIMRQLRLLRGLMPAWHRKERLINRDVRSELMGQLTKLAGPDQRQRLKQLENIKGYRDVRYEKAQPVLHKELA